MHHEFACRHQAGGQERRFLRLLCEGISDLAAGLLPTDMEVAPVRAQDAPVP